MPSLEAHTERTSTESPGKRARWMNTSLRSTAGRLAWMRKTTSFPSRIDSCNEDKMLMLRRVLKFTLRTRHGIVLSEC
jgi:hypothetical protein